MNNGAKSVQKKTKMYPYSSPAIISHNYIQGTISYNGIDGSARLILIDGENSFLLGKFISHIGNMDKTPVFLPPFKQNCGLCMVKDGRCTHY